VIAELLGPHLCKNRKGGPPAFDAFRIENGQIIEQQNHYDPRPATS
jgi:hypothetical protein